MVFFLYREKTRETAFDFLLQGIADSGFAITGLWPVRTAPHQNGDDLVRVAVVFRKKKERGNITTRRNFISALKHRLPAMLDSVWERDLPEEDKKIGGLGLGLEIFTTFARVLNADGTVLSLTDAMAFISQEVQNYDAVHATAAVQTEEE